MDQSTQQTLLALNERFYRTVAEPFDATRQGWTPGLQTIVTYFGAGTKEKLTALDVGCGNGRLARLLAEHAIACDYVGVDGNEKLLRMAAAATQGLATVDCRFVRADLADPGWAAHLPHADYDIIVCLATIQHLPGYDLRLRLLVDFARLCRGSIVLSFWQFLSSERFVARQMDWSLAGLAADQVEANDALLPWKQGVEAVRYVHQVDLQELRRLARDAGLTIEETFRADGREGNLNLYARLSNSAGPG